MVLCWRGGAEAGRELPRLGCRQMRGAEVWALPSSLRAGGWAGVCGAVGRGRLGGHGRLTTGHLPSSGRRANIRYSWGEGSPTLPAYILPPDSLHRPPSPEGLLSARLRLLWVARD